MLPFLLLNCVVSNNCSELCGPHATCYSDNYTYTCECTPPYYGTKCDSVNLCYMVNCGINARCDSGKCICKINFEGTNCEIKTCERFKGINYKALNININYTSNNASVTCLEESKIKLNASFTDFPIVFELKDSKNLILKDLYNNIIPGSGTVSKNLDTIMIEFIRSPNNIKYRFTKY